VAVKAIPAQKLSVHPHLRALLDAEVRALSAISHKNVIKLLDCLSTDKEVDLIYEFCEQGDLRTAFEHKPFEEPEALAVLHDLAEALLCLKQAGIVHRDLKPENVLISRGVVKLADFGLCRDLHGPPEQHLAHIGSYAFMAPETICSFEYSFATDMYAVGILMYAPLSQVRDPHRRAALHQESAGRTRRAEARLLRRTPKRPDHQPPVRPAAQQHGRLRGSLAADPRTAARRGAAADV